jgi:Escherichia/Staphylococcus phage prohead protease
MTTATKPKTIDALRAELKQLTWPREYRERGKVELRAAGDGRSIEMFIPFESESVDMGFREKIHPSAFTRSIRTGRSSPRNDIFALWSHDASQPLARQANGSLDFEEGEDGLRATAELDPTIDYHDRTLKLVKAGLVRGTSFGFETVREDWDYDDKDEAVRTLLEVKLHEVSPVVFPAYQDSDIEGRAAVAGVAQSLGLDLDGLLGALREVREGRFPLERREAVVAVLAQLGALVPDLPAVVADDDYYLRKLATRERLVGKAA